MRERTGQITVEYFLLFATIILVTVTGLFKFRTDIATTFQNLFSKARNSMPLDDGGPASPDSGGPQTDPVDPTPPPDVSPF